MDTLPVLACCVGSPQPLLNVRRRDQQPDEELSPVKANYKHKLRKHDSSTALFFDIVDQQPPVDSISGDDIAIAIINHAVDHGSGCYDRIKIAEEVAKNDFTHTEADSGQKWHPCPQVRFMPGTLNVEFPKPALVSEPLLATPTWAANAIPGSAAWRKDSTIQLPAMLQPTCGRHFYDGHSEMLHVTRPTAASSSLSLAPPQHFGSAEERGLRIDALLAEVQMFLAHFHADRHANPYIPS